MRKAKDDETTARNTRRHATEGPLVEEATLERIAAAVGERGFTRDAQEIAPHCISWRDNWQGTSPMLVMPDSSEQVAEVVRICHATATPIVPQGGNTGLTGASQPRQDAGEIILSTSRLNAVRDIDLSNDTMTVEAGCILENLQRLAQDNNRLFPLSLGAEGSCQIGGNLSTNAGGTQVLRYGNARNLVLGLEVVLPDGKIWHGLRGLRKDNTGYDIKQWFIGAEGTLGIITAAVLKLFPRPTDVQTALLGVTDISAAVDLLSRARTAFGEQISTFEVMHASAIELTQKHLPSISTALTSSPPWTVLLEVAGQGTPGTLQTEFEALLGRAFESDCIQDGVLATSSTQAQQFWAIREGIPEAQKHAGASVKHDVSIPVSKISHFIDEADKSLAAAYPGIRPVAFGHLGDGNIHYNVMQPEGESGDVFIAQTGNINRIVHDLVDALHGSISAEHGLGRLRLAEAERYKSNVELDLMRTLKRSLDEKNIMNPGKVVRID